MKLGEGEEKIAEYYFKGAGDVANMIVLTNRRLIVIYSNAEKSFPLSKITAVRVVFNRVQWMIIAGVIVILFGLCTFATMIASGDFSIIVAALVFFAIGAGLVYFGWKGKTHLLISQMGGNKYYAVRGEDPKLIEFVDAINNRLA